MVVACPRDLNNPILEPSGLSLGDSRAAPEQFLNYVLRRHCHVRPSDKARAIAVKVFIRAYPNEDGHQLIQQAVVRVYRLEVRHVSTMLGNAAQHPIIFRKTS